MRLLISLAFCTHHSCFTTCHNLSNLRHTDCLVLSDGITISVLFLHIQSATLNISSLHRSLSVHSVAALLQPYVAILYCSNMSDLRYLVLFDISYLVSIFAYSKCDCLNLSLLHRSLSVHTP